MKVKGDVYGNIPVMGSAVVLLHDFKVKVDLDFDVESLVKTFVQALKSEVSK